MGLPQFWGDMFNIPDSDSLGNFLKLTVVAAPHHEIAHSTELWLIAAAIAAALVGMAVGYWLYVSRPELPERLAASFAAIYRTLLEKYYVDEFYDRSLVRPLVALSDRILFRGVDAGLIDGIAVNGSARTVHAIAANGLKYLQSGLAQGYLFLMIVGTVAIVAYLLG